MNDIDPLRGAVQFWNLDTAITLAARIGVPGLAGPVSGLLTVVELSLLALLLSRLCASLQPLTGVARQGARLTAALVALVLFIWSVRHGDADIMSLFVRWDHLVFCAAAGYAISGLTQDWRRPVLIAISLYFVAANTGLLPTLLMLAGSLLALALLYVPVAQPLWLTALLQSAAMLGIFAGLWVLRALSLSASLATQGCFAFVLLRHVSYVVETRRGRPGGLVDYLCYLFFYTSYVGAVEIYSEFHSTNLVGGGRYDYRAASLKFMLGQLYAWAGLQLPFVFEQVILIRDPLELWGSMVLLFVRSALFAMGLWATIEGVALLYGVTLRPNFPNVIACLNPAQFWRSWRATMTNWLIHYIYIPLGGNRHDQVRNIAAAFLISVLWHWMGVPFYSAQLHAYDFLPRTVWGAINAAGVIGYVLARRRQLTLLPTSFPAPLRIAGKLLLMWVFGSLTVPLLTFTPDTMQYFAPFARRLLFLPTP